ncbi:hypothetical protein MW887_011868 [Aspergillus wentii]|nr:hypothetical protein MW887_011868 [Aspergillus wentii]
MSLHLITIFPSICLFLSFAFIIFRYRRQIIDAFRCRRRRWKYNHLEDDDKADESIELNTASFRLAADSDNNSDIEKGKKSERNNHTVLSKYFDPDTSLLREEIMEPLPPTPSWERDLNRRIDEGRGLGAWADRIIDRVARRFQSAMEVNATDEPEAFV